MRFHFWKVASISKPSFYIIYLNWRISLLILLLPIAFPPRGLLTMMATCPLMENGKHRFANLSLIYTSCQVYETVIQLPYIPVRRELESEFVAVYAAKFLS